MEKSKIGFIGAGNMAASLIGGLLADGFPADLVWVADVDRSKVEELARRFQVRPCDNNRQLAEQCDIVVLAVKPQQIREVAGEIAAAVRRKCPLVVSIAAGIRQADLASWLGDAVPIVRAMPNTPALVQTAATGLYANSQVSSSQKDNAESLLRAVGLTVWLREEDQLDAVTALSGSGPAYFFLLMEAMEKAGVALGLEQTVSRLLVEQTALGAAKLALESDLGPEQLRHKVTSPGGTTERALEVFQAGGFETLVGAALKAACERSKELSRQLGGKDE